MANIVKVLFSSFNLSIGSFSLPVSYGEAALVVFLVFLLVFSFAQFRRHNIDWSLKGMLFGTFFGFLLALTIEGFLIIGGKTVLTSVLGWKNPPAPISIALDAGRNKLVQVLGANIQVPTTLAQGSTTVTGAIQLLQSLNPSDIKKVKAIFCQ